jgi:hypothetical protein
MLINLEKTLELLNVTSIQGDPSETAKLVQWTQELVDERGEDYVRQNNQMLLNQWDYILSL